MEETVSVSPYWISDSVMRLNQNLVMTDILRRAPRGFFFSFCFVFFRRVRREDATLMSVQ